MAYLYINSKQGVAQIPFSDLRCTHFHYYAGDWHEELWIEVHVAGIQQRYVVGRFVGWKYEDAQRFVEEIWEHKNADTDMYIGAWKDGIPICEADAECSKD